MCPASAFQVSVKTAKRHLMFNAGPHEQPYHDLFLCAILQLHNTPDPDCNLSPAQIIFGRPIRDTLWFVNHFEARTQRHKINQGVVVESAGHDQYRVKVDDSERITLRNRSFLRAYTPATPSIQLEQSAASQPPTSSADQCLHPHPLVPPLHTLKFTHTWHRRQTT